MRVALPFVEVVAMKLCFTWGRVFPTSTIVVGGVAWVAGGRGPVAGIACLKCLSGHFTSNGPAPPGHQRALGSGRRGVLRAAE